MTEIVIVVSPSLDSRNKRRIGRFDVRLQGCDEIICAATQKPLLDSSRELVRRGFDPLTIVNKVHESAPSIVRLRAPLGIAAGFDVMGSRFVRRKPAAGPMKGPRRASQGANKPRDEPD